MSVLRRNSTTATSFLRKNLPNKKSHKMKTKSTQTLGTTPRTLRRFHLVFIGLGFELKKMFNCYKRRSQTMSNMKRKERCIPQLIASYFAFLCGASFVVTFYCGEISPLEVILPRMWIYIYDFGYGVTPDLESFFLPLSFFLSFFLLSVFLSVFLSASFSVSFCVSFLMPPLSLLSLCLSISLYLSLCFSLLCLSVCLSLSFSLSLSFCLSLTLPLSLSATLTLFLSPSLSHSVCLSLSLSLCLPLSHTHTHSLSFCLSLSLSFYLYIFI